MIKKKFKEIVNCSYQDGVIFTKQKQIYLEYKAQSVSQEYHLAAKYI